MNDPVANYARAQRDWYDDQSDPAKFRRAQHAERAARRYLRSHPAEGERFLAAHWADVPLNFSSPDEA